MKFSIVHANINVTDWKKSLRFYERALGLHMHQQKASEDGSFVLTYLADDSEGFLLELTWLRDHPQAYDLGENESHIAFQAEDFAAAHALHEEMGCIVFENQDMGIYFIADPDNYWLEVVPAG